MYDHIMNNMAELQDDIIKLSRNMTPKSYKVMSRESPFRLDFLKSSNAHVRLLQGKTLLNPDIHLSL